MVKRNERKTELIVQKKLEERGYFSNADVIVSAQTTDDPLIDKLLRSASKSGDGCGRPEFIIQSKVDREFIIVVECKADPTRHASKQLDRPNEFAVDGALHYANHLCRNFNVLAIAASGQTAAELKLSHFIIRKGQFTKYEALTNERGTEVKDILAFKNYFDLFIYDHIIHTQKERDVLDFSKRLHNFIRDYAHLGDDQKPLVVSGILLALKDTIYFQTYTTYPDDRLPKFTLDTIKQVIDAQDIPNSKKLGVKQQYGFLQTHTKLVEFEASVGKSPLKHIIDGLCEHVLPFVTIYQDYDIVGKFYNEFLRYSGGDGKLGIVLTPKHITELFADLAQVSRTDTVIDPCCGTGGFLIAAMSKMRDDCAGDEVAYTRVKRHGLIGVESLPRMFALAASNMILRGDGSCQLFEGSCFNESHIRDIIPKGAVWKERAEIESSKYRPNEPALFS